MVSTEKNSLTQIHDVVPANRAVVDNNIPRPQRHLFGQRKNQHLSENTTPESIRGNQMLREGLPFVIHLQPSWQKGQTHLMRALAHADRNRPQTFSSLP
jgi:hypothetical protein